MYSATILVSEILPRGQNLFSGCQKNIKFLDAWNHDAGEVNRILRRELSEVSWAEMVHQQEFHTLYGKIFLIKFNIHINFKGTPPTPAVVTYIIFFVFVRLH
jgi:hypothetical protein